MGKGVESTPEIEFYNGGRISVPAEPAWVDSPYLFIQQNNAIVLVWWRTSKLTGP